MIPQSKLCLDILPPSQKNVWAKLSNLPKEFVLYGGTSIALRLGHRQSIDFDFFSHLPFSHESILAITGLVGKNYKIIQAEKNTLSVILGDGGPIKLSFFGGLGFGRVGVPEEIADNGMKLASLEDLFGHKLKGLLQRVEAKDYMDLVALLLNGLKLKDGIEAALGLFGNVFSPMEALKAMVYFKGGDLEQLTKAQRQILIASHKDLPNFFTAKKVLSSSLV